MARLKGILYGGSIVKNLYSKHISTSSQNTQILKHTTVFRMFPSTTMSCQARRTFCNQEVTPPPPPPSSSNQGKWTAGIVVTMVITLLQFKEDVDVVMETAEEIMDVVEVMAEAVEKVAEKIADDLPDGSKLKTTMEITEQVAETVAEKAQKAVEFIDEVQAAEQKLGPIIEPVKQATQETPSEAS